MRSAAFLTVHDYPGGAEALGVLVGIPAPTLRNKVNPNNDRDHLTFNEAMRIQHLTGDHRILHAIAAELGYAAAPDGGADQDATISGIDYMPHSGRAIDGLEWLADALAKHIEVGASSVQVAEEAKPEPLPIEVDRASKEDERLPGGEDVYVAAKTDTQDLRALPDKLRIAIDAHQAIVADPLLVEGRSPKQAIEAWLDKHHSSLSSNAKELIAQIANPQPGGGSPTTPKRKPIPPR